MSYYMMGVGIEHRIKINVVKEGEVYKIDGIEKSRTTFDYSPNGHRVIDDVKFL